MFCIEPHKLHEMFHDIQLGHKPKTVVENLFHSLPQAQKDKIFDQDFRELNLSVRAHGCLEKANLRTIRDVILFSNSKHLISIRGIGTKTVDEIFDALEMLGIDPTNWITKRAAEHS